MPQQPRLRALGRATPAHMLLLLVSAALLPRATPVSLAKRDDFTVVSGLQVPGTDPRLPAFVDGPYACDALMARRCASFGVGYRLQKCDMLPEGRAARLAQASHRSTATPIDDVDGYARTVHTYTCSKALNPQTDIGDGCGGTPLFAAPVTCVQSTYVGAGLGAAGSAGLLGPLAVSMEGDERESEGSMGDTFSPDVLNRARLGHRGATTCSCIARRDWTGRSDPGLIPSLSEDTFPLDRRYPDTPDLVAQGRVRAVERPGNTGPAGRMDSRPMPSNPNPGIPVPGRDPRNPVVEPDTPDFSDRADAELYGAPKAETVESPYTRYTATGDGRLRPYTVDPGVTTSTPGQPLYTGVAADYATPEEPQPGARTTE